MKNTTNVPEKMPYTKGEKIAEILCGIMIAAALAFYMYLVYMIEHDAYVVVIMLISAAVYGMLTVFSVRADLVSKYENIRRNRRVFIAVKIVVIALLLTVSVMITFSWNMNVFDWYYF